jgi:dipeptidyl aminopeptidase/acylaminoacyl peptidase
MAIVRWRRLCVSLVGVLLRRAVVVSLLLLAVPAATLAQPAPAPGSILAPAARQAAWLSLEAPRPRPLTQILAPGYIGDVALSVSGSAVVALYAPFDGTSGIGGDLLRLDVATRELTPLVTRTDATESLAAPVWYGEQIAYQREDLSIPAVGYAYQAAVRYPSRIEVVQSDGSERQVLIENGRQPSPSPDASQLVFVRSAPIGSAILLGDGVFERELIPSGTFIDAAAPRFSPDGNHIAFVVATPSSGQSNLLDFLFAVKPAYAHGLPFNVWLMGADGSEPHLLANVNADDPSLAWSPDGAQLFVYSGTGSHIVDVASGEVADLPYLVGYGTIAWVP